MLASLKVPVAANCCVPPTKALGFDGVTTTNTSVPVPTVKVVVPDTPKALAVIVTLPLFLPCAMPDPRTEAMFGCCDFQETPLRFVTTLPSLNVPVAVSLIEVPALMRGLTGDTLIDTRLTLDTVNPVDPLIVP